MGGISMPLVLAVAVILSLRNDCRLLTFAQQFSGRKERLSFNLYVA